MIDRQTRNHAQTFGVRDPAPTTVSYGTGLTERRGRHSGQIDDKPCTRCGEAVVLDSRRMRTADGRPVLACLACGMLVGVRRSDLYRSAPEEPTSGARDGGRRGRWGRLARRSRAAAPPKDRVAEQSDDRPAG